MHDLANENIIIGLDLGSSNICASVCSIDEENQVHIAGVGTSITEGIVRGNIVNPQLVQRAVKRALSRAERIAKASSNRVIIGVNPPQYLFLKQQASVTLPETREQVSYEDKIAVLKLARNMSEEDSYTVVHTIPVRFYVDGTLCPTDPVGMFGRELKADVLIVQFTTELVNNVKQVCDDLNLIPVAIVASQLAAGRIALTTEELNSSVCLINIGGGTTQLALYRENALSHFATFPLGGERISADIGMILKTSTGDAERLKILFADVGRSTLSKEENIEFLCTNSDRETTLYTSEFFLNEIIKARLEEILQLSVKEITRNAGQELPEHIVITGGTSNMKGLADFATYIFKKQVRIGIPKDKEEVIESQNYATCIGLLIYAIKNRLVDVQRTKLSTGGKLRAHVRKWFKDFF